MIIAFACNSASLVKTASKSLSALAVMMGSANPGVLDAYSRFRVWIADKAVLVGLISRPITLAPGTKP